MPTPAQKNLIQDLNDINRLPESQHTLATSLQKASLLSQIAAQAKTPTESDFFLMQAISLLEALSLTAFDENLTAFDKQKLASSTHENAAANTTTDTNTATYQQIQTQLAFAYIALAKLKQEDKFYTLAKKLLKPFSKTGDAKVLQALIRITAHQKEPAMCQFYLQKLLALPSFQPNMLNHAELHAFHHTDWYQKIRKSVIFD